MVQISCNPADLNGAQRKAVADFVLNFPGACVALVPQVNELEALQHDHESTMPEAAFGAVDTAPADFVLNFPGACVALVPQVNELEALQHDHESTMPEAAFGAVDTAPAAAFGLPDIGQLEVSPAAAFGGAPAAPANTAPITTTPGPVSLAAGAAPAGVELDEHGLPWDNRIHAESKGKIADGSWRKKRGVDPALVAQVEAELRQVMGAPSGPLGASTVPSAPTPPLATAAPVTVSLPTASVSPAVVPPPPAPAPAALGVEVAQPDPRQQFVALIGRASAAIQAGKVTQEEIKQVCQGAGIPALPLLANRLDLVATVAASIDAIIASRGQ